MVLLKDLLEKELKAKNYYKDSKNGRYVIKKKRKYYTTCNSEEEAKRIVQKLEQCNWDANQIQRIKKEVGVVKKPRRETIGFLNTYLEETKAMKKGYRYMYSIKKDGKYIRITSKSLKKLKKTVEEKGFEWKPLTEDAKKINEIISRMDEQ